MTSSFRYGANVQANGIRQHYLRYGPANERANERVNGPADGAAEGPGPVVIVPGITSPAVTWGFVAERFGQRFDTYVLDVRGRGLSAAGDSLDYGVDAQADDLRGFLQALGLTRCSLVGHSMGARIATRALRRGAPEAARLVMVDPPVSGPGRRAYPSKLPWYVDSIRQAAAGMSAEDMRAFCPSWSAEQRALRAEWLHTCDERAVRQSFADFHEDDFHADLPQIAIPARLIRAGRGEVILDEDVVELRQLLPGLEVETVPQAGHMIPWDDEAGFYRAFGTFLGAAV